MIGNLLSAEAELVSGFGDLAFFVEMNFDHFFGLKGGSFFVCEAGDDFAGFDVDDVAGAWVGKFAVEGKGDPAGLVAKFDALELFRRFDGVVENLHAGIVGVGDPDFFFVGSEANAMAGAAVAFGGAHLETLDFDVVKFFAGFEVAYFEAEEAVEVHVAACFGNGEGPNEIFERADFFDDGVGFGVGDAEQRRAQAGEVSVFAVEGVNGVMGAGAGFDAF